MPCAVNISVTKFLTLNPTDPKGNSYNSLKKRDKKE